MIEVSIISCTPNPVSAISLAAGTSYGKNYVSVKRMYNCFKAGHTSVMEHASVTFRVSGISRACSHQLVRHRLASYVQKSQRYTKIDTDSDWYVMPPAFESGTDISTGAYLRDDYKDTMHDFALLYTSALANGIKPEDARYLLPEACKTEIVVTMNVRELFAFLDLRQDSHAQWEIREMANEVERVISEINDGWAQVMKMRKEQ